MDKEVGEEVLDQVTKEATRPLSGQRYLASCVDWNRHELKARQLPVCSPQEAQVPAARSVN